MIKNGSIEIDPYVGNTPVDKIYLGSDVVFTRGAGYGYVANGLVFHLDGIDKGQDPSAWTDLVGGVSFPLNSYVQSEQDAIVTDGTGAIMGGSTALAYNFGSSTIEVCVERLDTKSYGCVFYNIGGGNVAFITSGNNNVVTAISPATAMFTLDTNTGKNTYSCLPTKVVKNGVSFNTITSESWTSMGMLSIGARTRNGTSFTYGAKFRIHSIRIYNRILTDDEVASNQAVDNERFNLGLQLSE